MWKYQQKEHKKYKISYLHEESLPNLSLYMLINVMLIRNMYIKEYCGFVYASRYCCWLCTWINKRGVWNKRGGWQNSPKLINGECRIRLGTVAKNGIINKWGVPSIWNSRVKAFQGPSKHWTDFSDFCDFLLLWRWMKS